MQKRYIIYLADRNYCKIFCFFKTLLFSDLKHKSAAGQKKVLVLTAVFKRQATNSTENKILIPKQLGPFGEIT